MRHAYLIIAHANWEQLKLLIKLLDHANNDLFIHIDKKAKNVPTEELKASAVKSTVHIYSEYKVYWGSFELVRTELLLFEKAHQYHYNYYHLLSGSDLPIKSNEYIDAFFEAHKGMEFVHFDTEERLRTDRMLWRRIRLYHFFQNYRRRYKIPFFNALFTFMERVLLALQLALGVDRRRSFPEFIIKFGSQWVSITDDLVEHILSQKDLIYKVFPPMYCTDELFIQSLVYNSDFKDRLFDRNYDDDIHANMRLIDMKTRGKNGSPYTWRIGDWDEIRASDCLFARKFDSNSDSEIIEKVIHLV